MKSLPVAPRAQKVTVTVIPGAAKAALRFGGGLRPWSKSVPPGEGSVSLLGWAAMAVTRRTALPSTIPSHWQLEAGPGDSDTDWEAMARLGSPSP